MRLSQTAQSGSRKNTVRKYVDLGNLSATPNSQNWTTVSTNLGRASADRHILAIISRFETGNNAIFNPTLDGVSGVKLMGLAPSNSSVTDVYVFPNRTSATGALTASGGAGSVTARYSVSFLALYGFAFPTTNQSENSTDSATNDEYRNFAISTGTSVSVSGAGIRRSPHFLIFTATADYNLSLGQVAGLPTGVPGGLTQLTNAVLTVNATRSMTVYHGITTNLRTTSTFSASVSWGTNSIARWTSAIPIS